jgi:hypothetical protein
MFIYVYLYFNIFARPPPYEHVLTRPTGFGRYSGAFQIVQHLGDGKYNEKFASKYLV